MEENQQVIYKAAMEILADGYWQSLEYFKQEDVSKWATAVYNSVGSTKTIEHRLTSGRDMSVIYSKTRVSVVDNDNGKMSWVSVIQDWEYTSLYDDLKRILMNLEFVLLRLINQ